MRMTAQRKAILDAIKKLKTHPTADELYAIVKKYMPRISLATVYRNLEILASEGYIRRLNLGVSGQRRYDGNPEPHYHVVCMKCGKVGDVHLKENVDVKNQITDCDGFYIDSVHLEFWGLCPECANKMKREEKLHEQQKH